MRRGSLRRERHLAFGAAFVTAALLLAVVIALLTASRTSSHGCIDYTVPYSTGGGEIYRCGPAARATCSAPVREGGGIAQTVAAIRAACRKAGLPVG